jgi:pyruvate/2-oxoglutarate dehydrogenase complex dihydrolipoamide acyltransferase (E2) component
MMGSEHEAYEIKPFPRLRQLVLDSAYIASRKHSIHGLIEVDVTRPRHILSEHKARSGETFSFTAFTLACIGRAVDENRMAHAYRDWRNRLVIFEEVDVLIAVEIENQGVNFPLVHALRGVNKRSARELHEEIRTIQADPGGDSDFSLLSKFARLPGFARRLGYRVVAANPTLQKRFAGTVGLTSVGMFGTRFGWGLGLPGHNLAITLASITEKPMAVDGSVELRQVLPVTISFNHDVIDGAPAARFAQRFAELLESGEMLAGVI